MKTLKQVYSSYEKDNQIDPSLYSQHNVKQGLRNEDGTGVKVGLTKICDVVGYEMVDGKKKNVDGKLIFRGYSIQDLIQMDNAFENTAFLLIFGKLPNQEELNIFHQTLMDMNQSAMIDESYTTSNILNALQIDILKMYSLDPNPDSDTLEERMIRGLAVLSSMPLFVFSNYHHKKITRYPCPDESFAKNILALIRQNKDISPQEIQAMDTLLVLHADHGGGNNSTFANVVISSTGTDIYSCISASVGSLKGPRHGGANAKVYQQFLTILQDVGTTQDPEILYDIAVRLLKKDYFDKSGLIYGIGHAIYTISDPRATAMKETCQMLAHEKGKDKHFETLVAFEKAAIQAMKDIKGIDACPNVDFYSGLTYSLLGIDQSLFTPMFCIARTAGWVAHHLENRQNNRKLIRPANVYVGFENK